MKVTELLGATAVVFGFAVLASEGLARTFGLTEAFVLLVGLLASVQGLRFALARRHREYRQTETADPERRYRAPVPGEDVDESLREARGFSRRSARVRESLAEDVRAAARDALVARGDYTESAAQAALEEGTWTDDPVAAWFLGTDQSFPLGERVRGLLRRESRFQRGARRAIDAISRVQEGER